MTPTTPVLYFAYGSNMQTATFSGRRGIPFRRARPARANGWRLVLDKPPMVSIGEGFASIVPDPEATVIGVVYEITTADLEHVDLTEGVLIDNYRRIEIPVSPLDAPSDVLRVQTLTSDRRDPTLRPSDRYMGLVVAGAEEHGLQADWIAFLRAIPTCAESPESRQFRPILDDVMRRRR
ncbi:MAG: gamma-glutamylcyclotransferase, partial [Thermoplasmata archaeon]|nr:gamma-glutamylcyclotransferase [Thermoplasmata archaeon]